MIKAIFFDFYHTLVRFEPTQEEAEAAALKEFGVEAAPEDLRRPVVMADEFIYREISKRPLSQRSTEEKLALYAGYQRTLLEEAGIEAGDKLVMGLLAKMQQAKMDLVLFDDVAPVLTDLKKRGLVLGLISNVENDMSAKLEELGLTARLDIIITSRDTGYNKPHPQIFQAALERAGVLPGEAIYVGDQYQVDVVGSTAAGMKGVLIDRHNYFSRITDAPRIQGLGELAGLLEG